MRGQFRKILKKGRKFDRLLFLAPIACALILLLFYAQDKAAFAAAWRSPLALLSDRSPGSRDAGALYSTKPKQRSKPGYQVKPGLGLPQERVLPVTRERSSPLDDLLFPADLPLVPLGDTAFPSDALGMPGLSAPGGGGLPGPGGGGFPGLFGVPGGGEAPQLTTPDAPDTPDTPGLPDLPTVPGVVPPPVIDTPPPGGNTPATAVPEPSTWAMMILGFGLISSAMRRTRRSLPRRAPVRGNS